MSRNALNCRVVPPSPACGQNWGSLVEVHPDLCSRLHGVAVVMAYCAGCGPWRRGEPT